jgi:hypothetical protein
MKSMKTTAGLALGSVYKGNADQNHIVTVKKSILPLISLTFSILTLSLPPLQAETQGVWSSSAKNTRQTLSHSSQPVLLGLTTPVVVVFACDPTWDKESSGTLGFDVSIKNPSKITSFPFADFEGPDAVAAPDVRVTLIRKGQPPLSFKALASGGFSEVDTFTFYISEVSKLTKSVPRSILQALAENEAESLKITLSDPRNAKLALELVIPVAGQQAKFKTLLAGLK